MRGYDWARLLGLTALWSLQYIFLRISVPTFGIAPVAEMRAVFGATFLVVAALLMRQRIAPLAHWKDYLAVSVSNNVLPFVCMSWAAAILPAGYMAIINGTVPLWAGVFSAWMLKDSLRPQAIVGFALGLAGVALIVNLGPVALDARTALGAVVSLVGAALWGFGGVVIKQRSARMPAVGMAAGSIGFAALLMLPLLTFAPPPSAWTPGPAAALVALGALCSGAAYLAFFSLVRDIGPTRSLTPGLMVPVLGVLWGWLFLDESVTLAVLGGITLVVAALVLVLRR